MRRIEDMATLIEKIAFIGFCVAIVIMFASLGVVISGCSSAQTMSHADADRAIFDAVAPEWHAYFEADPALTDEQKMRRERTLFFWDRHVHPTATAAPAAPTATAGPPR